MPLFGAHRAFEIPGTPGFNPQAEDPRLRPRSVYSSPAVAVDVRARRQAEHAQRRIEEITRNRRLLVLFFDLASMPVKDLMRTLKATREFVERQMTPADLVSVVTYASSLRVLANFTNQRERLLEALGQIRLGESVVPAEKRSGGETVLLSHACQSQS